MMGDYQVRFCERLGGATPPCLLGVLWQEVGQVSAAGLGTCKASLLSSLHETLKTFRDNLSLLKQ